MDWKSLVKIIASTVIPIAFPKLTPAVPFIVHGIEVAEDFGGSGSDKLEKAVKIANDGMQATNQIAGKEVIDISAANSVLANGISAVVDASKVVKKQTDK